MINFSAVPFNYKLFNADCTRAQMIFYSSEIFFLFSFHSHLPPYLEFKKKKEKKFPDDVKDYENVTKFDVNNAHHVND